MALAKTEKPTGAVDNTNDSNQPDAASTPQKVCGIVMPIAAIGDEYSEEHWRRVRKIIGRAISAAKMRSQLVWENPEVDVIQSAILQNLYENDVVICDVSGLNPNVMLEAGLRLSTKRPTIIITDRVQKPPFDISTIGYIEYQRDLEFNAIDDFIDRLSKKIIAVSKAADEDTYQSFVQHYKFETVTPATINISAEQHIKDRLDDLFRAIERIERPRIAPSSTATPAAVRVKNPWRDFVRYVIRADADTVAQIEAAIDEYPYLICHSDMFSSDDARLNIRYSTNFTFDRAEALEKVEAIVSFAATSFKIVK